MEALKKNLSVMGARLKDGAAELAERHDQNVVKPLKTKAENFVANHGGGTESQGGASAEPQQEGGGGNRNGNNRRCGNRNRHHNSNRV